MNEETDIYFLKSGMPRKRSNQGVDGSVGLARFVQVMWRSPSANEPGITPDRLEPIEGGELGGMNRHFDKHTGRMAQIGLTQQVALRQWPIPTGTERSGINPNTGKGEGLSKTVKNIPTPQSATSIGPRFLDGGKHALQKLRDQFGDDEGRAMACGQLNPDWVEFLMGWVIGWTSLDPLPKENFNDWIRKTEVTQSRTTLSRPRNAEMPMRRTGNGKTSSRPQQTIGCSVSLQEVPRHDPQARTAGVGNCWGAEQVEEPYQEENMPVVRDSVSIPAEPSDNVQSILCEQTGMVEENTRIPGKSQAEWIGVCSEEMGLWDIDPADMEESEFYTTACADDTGLRRAPYAQGGHALSFQVGQKLSSIGPIPRVATGIKDKVNRLKALGNGQVSLCAATAFRILAGQ